MGRTGEGIHALESFLISEDKKKKARSWWLEAESLLTVRRAESTRELLLCSGVEGSSVPILLEGWDPLSWVRTPIPEVRPLHPWDQNPTGSRASLPPPLAYEGACEPSPGDAEVGHVLTASNSNQSVWELITEKTFV